MLVLSRKRSESIIIDGRITIQVADIIRGHKVRLGIDAPRAMRVDRWETHLARLDIPGLVKGGMSWSDILAAHPSITEYDIRNALGIELEKGAAS
jgi:carbon storage regulator CsrA